MHSIGNVDVERREDSVFIERSSEVQLVRLFQRRISFFLSAKREIICTQFGHLRLFFDNEEFLHKCNIYSLPTSRFFDPVSEQSSFTASHDFLIYFLFALN